MSFRQDEIAAAALQYYTSQTRDPKVSSFQAGAEWADAHRPESIQALEAQVAALTAQVVTSQLNQDALEAENQTLKVKP